MTSFSRGFSAQNCSPMKISIIFGRIHRVHTVIPMYRPMIECRWVVLHHVADHGLATAT